jgi:hypothetical protein
LRKAEARARKQARREAKDEPVFCGKVRYTTEAEARAGRVEARAPRWIRAYKCRACGGWHLTSKAHPRWAKAGEAA